MRLLLLLIFVSFASLPLAGLVRASDPIVLEAICANAEARGGLCELRGNGIAIGGLKLIEIIGGGTDAKTGAPVCADDPDGKRNPRIVDNQLVVTGSCSFSGGVRAEFPPTEFAGSYNCGYADEHEGVCELFDWEKDLYGDEIQVLSLVGKPTCPEVNGLPSPRVEEGRILASGSCSESGDFAGLSLPAGTTKWVRLYYHWVTDLDRPQDLLKQLRPPATEFLISVNISDDSDYTMRTGEVTVPDGYRICAAHLETSGTDVPPGASFNVSIYDLNRKLGYYEVQGTGTKNFNEAVVGNTTSAHLVLEVRKATSGLGGCMRPGVVWLCGKGAPAGERECGEVQPGGVVQAVSF